MGRTVDDTLNGAGSPVRRPIHRPLRGQVPAVVTRYVPVKDSIGRYASRNYDPVTGLKRERNNA